MTKSWYQTYARRRIRSRIVRFGLVLARYRGKRLVDEMADYLRAFGQGLDNLDFDMRQNGELRVLTIVRNFHCARIIDVGANVGEWGELVAELMPGAEIHAFEVLPVTFELLNDRLGKRKGMKLNAVGLSDRAEEVDIWFKGAGDCKATANRIEALPLHRASETYDQCAKCAVMRGDVYLERNRLDVIDFIKIDVEGMEYRVLKGFGKRISDFRVIQFEYGIFNIGARALLADIWQLLEESGFVVGKIFPRGVQFGSYHHDLENFCGGNFLAVQTCETSLINKLAGSLVPK